MKKVSKYLFILLFLAIDAFGQPGVGDPNGGGKPGAVPISGIEILLGIGGLMGVKKLFSKKKSSQH